MTIQGTEEWLAERVGFATASRFKDIMATIKTGEAAARRNYRAQLVVERLTGKQQDSFQNDAMRHGTETEPDARIAYEATTGKLVGEVGFIKHNIISAGCSPDGLIGEDGGLEIKCPYQTAIHIETLLTGMPSEHIAQIQGAMWITGRKWWDFVSFDPRLPEHLQLRIERIERDASFIAKLESQVEIFLREVNENVRALQSLQPAQAA